jgi:hypothetical protein
MPLAAQLALSGDCVFAARCLRLVRAPLLGPPHARRPIACFRQPVASARRQLASGLLASRLPPTGPRGDRPLSDCRRGRHARRRRSEGTAARPRRRAHVIARVPGAEGRHALRFVIPLFRLHTCVACPGFIPSGTHRSHVSCRSFYTASRTKFPYLVWGILFHALCHILVHTHVGVRIACALGSPVHSESSCPYGRPSNRRGDLLTKRPAVPRSDRSARASVSSGRSGLYDRPTDPPLARPTERATVGLRVLPRTRASAAFGHPGPRPARARADGAARALVAVRKRMLRASRGARSTRQRAACRSVADPFVSEVRSTL